MTKYSTEALDELVEIYGRGTYQESWDSLGKQVATGYRDKILAAHPYPNIPKEIIPTYNSFNKVIVEGLTSELVDMGVKWISKELNGAAAQFMSQTPDSAVQGRAAEAVFFVSSILIAAGAAADRLDESSKPVEDPGLTMLYATTQDPKFKALVTSLSKALKTPISTASEKVFDTICTQATTLYHAYTSEYLRRMVSSLHLLEQTTLNDEEPAVTASTDADTKTRTMTRFDYKQPKTAGNEPGIMVQKQVKEADDPTKKKYGYTWMVKHQPAQDTIVEYLSAGLYRYFVGDNAPKMRLVANADIGEAPFLASRFIDNFQNLDTAINGSSLSPRKKNDEGLKIPGSLYLVAVSVFLGNYDIHGGNRGVVTKGAAQEAAIVDLGRSLTLRAGFDGIAEKGNKIALAGANNLKPLRHFRPEDMIRALHRGHYKINSPNFLNKEFAEALEAVADKVEDDPNAFAHIIMGSAKEVRHAYKDYGKKDELNARLGKIAPGTTLGNLGTHLRDELMERTEMMRDFAFNIRIQVAIRDNDVKTLKSLLASDPEALDKPIKWLTEDNAEVIYPPSTIEEFAENRGASKEMMDVIAAAERWDSVEIIGGDVALDEDATYEFEEVPEEDAVPAAEEMESPVLRPFERLQRTIPGALAHANFEDFARLVCQKVYAVPGMDDEEGYVIAVDILKGLYQNIPEGKYQAIALNHPLYLAADGVVHRQANWEKCVNDIVGKEVAKAQGKSTDTSRSV